MRGAAGKGLRRALLLLLIMLSVQNVQASKKRALEIHQPKKIPNCLRIPNCPEKAPKKGQTYQIVKAAAEYGAPRYVCFKFCFEICFHANDTTWNELDDENMKTNLEDEIFDNKNISNVF